MIYFMVGKTDPRITSDLMIIVVFALVGFPIPDQMIVVTIRFVFMNEFGLNAKST